MGNFNMLVVTTFKDGNFWKSEVWTNPTNSILITKDLVLQTTTPLKFCSSWLWFGDLLQSDNGEAICSCVSLRRSSSRGISLRCPWVMTRCSSEHNDNRPCISILNPSPLDSPFETLNLSAKSFQFRVSMGNFNMLPLEIMLDILSRLPAESVVESKLVSKTWRNVVQHPSFLQMQLNHLNDPDDSGKSSFIFYTIVKSDEQFSYIEYDEILNRFSRTTRMNLRPPFKFYYIIGSCHGLICFNACNDINLPFNPAYICNPITREYILLPESNSQGYLLIGFGYTPSTNEYKVVRICKSECFHKSNLVQVYTLGSGIGWRNVSRIYYDVISVRQNGVFVNGAIYWVGQGGTIVAFDMADEEVCLIPSPSTNLSPSYGFELHALGDFLSAYQKNSGGWDIWFSKMNKNNQDVIWSKEFSHLDAKPITLTKSGGLLCYDYRDRNVYHYAPKASSSRMLGNFGEIFDFGLTHKNTLVSLKALGKEDTKLMDSCGRASSSGKTESNHH